MTYKYQESAIIYNKIAKGNDKAMSLLGVTKEKIDKAMHQCVSAGMSRKQAMRTIYKMWNYAEPEDSKEDETK